MQTKQLESGPDTNSAPSGPSGAVAGVVLSGIGFILTSMFQIGVLADYAGYRSLFQHLPESLTFLRYLISWGACLFGLVVGAGLFSRREFFRKGGIVLGCVFSAGVFGKYPFEGFAKYLHQQSEQMAASSVPFSPASVIQFAHAWNIAWLTESAMVWGCIALLMFFEISFYFAIIFFLTRPSVKALFR